MNTAQRLDAIKRWLQSEDEEILYQPDPPSHPKWRPRIRRQRPVAIGILIALWIGCGALHYGLDLGYSQYARPNLATDSCKRDRSEAFVTSFMGPLSLVLGLTWQHFFSIRGIQGVSWRCLTSMEIHDLLQRQ